MDYGIEEMEETNPDIETPDKLRRAETQDLLNSLDETNDEEERRTITLELQRRGEFDPMEDIDEAGTIVREPSAIEKVTESEEYEKTKSVAKKSATALLGASKEGAERFMAWKNDPERKRRARENLKKLAGGKKSMNLVGGTKPREGSTRKTNFMGGETSTRNKNFIGTGKSKPRNFLGTGKSKKGKFNLGGKAKKIKWF